MIRFRVSPQIGVADGFDEAVIDKHRARRHRHRLGALFFAMIVLITEKISDRLAGLTHNPPPRISGLVAGDGASFDVLPES